MCFLTPDAIVIWVLSAIALLLIGVAMMVFARVLHGVRLPIPRSKVSSSGPQGKTEPSNV